MIHNVRAIVLWSRRSREADKIVGLFTNKMGRVTAKAASAARSVAKFAALTEPFVESDIALYFRPGHGWGKITGGTMVRSFPGLRTDLEKSTAASWVCEVMHRLTPEEQSSPDKFVLLQETLESLEMAAHLNVIRLAFAVRFLSLVGFGLDHQRTWIGFQQEHPSWSEALLHSPLQALGTSRWESEALTAVEHLAGSLVQDSLNRPLHVNKFRQMTGIAI